MHTLQAVRVFGSPCSFGGATLVKVHLGCVLLCFGYFSSPICTMCVQPPSFFSYTKSPEQEKLREIRETYRNRRKDARDAQKNNW